MGRWDDGFARCVLRADELLIAYCEQCHRPRPGTVQSCPVRSGTESSHQQSTVKVEDQSQSQSQSQSGSGSGSGSGSRSRSRSRAGHQAHLDQRTTEMEVDSSRVCDKEPGSQGAEADSQRQRRKSQGAEAEKSRRTQAGCEPMI